MMDSRDRTVGGARDDVPEATIVVDGRLDGEGVATNVQTDPFANRFPFVVGAFREGFTKIDVFSMLLPVID